jgi:hypothetical protein
MLFIGLMEVERKKANRIQWFLSTEYIFLKRVFK